MKLFQKIGILILVFFFVQCKNEIKQISISNKKEIKYAKGFSIENFEGFSILTVKNPWPKATKTYKYILQEKKRNYSRFAQAKYNNSNSYKIGCGDFYNAFAIVRNA
jgi:hypothetical protein